MAEGFSRDVEMNRSWNSSRSFFTVLVCTAIVIAILACSFHGALGLESKCRKLYTPAERLLHCLTSLIVIATEVAYQCLRLVFSTSAPHLE